VRLTLQRGRGLERPLLAGGGVEKSRGIDFRMWGVFRREQSRAEQSRADQRPGLPQLPKWMYAVRTGRLAVYDI